MKIKNPNGRSVKDGGENFNKSKRTVVDVLVLGAGLAGLGAASKLKTSGLSFLLFEGQSKAGGRVNTMELLTNSCKDVETNDTPTIFLNTNKANNKNYCNQTVIDSGAQWLHGKHNNLHDVAKRHNLLATEQSEEGLGVFLRDDGMAIDKYFVNKIDFIIGQILGDCEKYARENLSSYPKSVHSFLLENFNKFVETLDDERREKAKQLLDWHIRFQIIDNSCNSLDHVSAKSWGKYSYNGESCQAHYNFKNGFSSAAEAIVTELDTKNLLFDKEIVEIKTNSSTSLPKMSVKCSDNTVYYANHVIVTFSLGILKAGLESAMFSPPLPTIYAQTIRDIGFETINKLFFQFDHEWWNDYDGIQLIFKNQNYEGANWTRHISGFDVMKPGPNHTLLAWVGGRGALQMEQLSDKQIIEDCMTLLEQFTKKKIPAPIKYYCTRWNKNPYIRGAYSYISTDCDKNGTSSQQLSVPITLKDLQMDLQNTTKSLENLNLEQNSLPNTDNNINQYSDTDDGHLPILLFAGEACHEVYFSTAHGAFLSGQEQAAKILEFYNL